MPKPFDLERAQAGDKVVTRWGGDYKFGAYNLDADAEHEVVGWIDGVVFHHDSFGRYYGDRKESPHDLFMAEEVSNYSMNVYANKSDLTDFLEGTRDSIILTSKMFVISDTIRANVELNWEE